MKTPFPLKSTRQTLSVIGFGLLLLGTSGLLRAESVEMNMPAGNYSTHLGTRALKDPSGATHTRQEIKNKVVVGIFSAPNMSQGDTQQKWSDILATHPDTKVSDEVALILVEDI